MEKDVNYYYFYLLLIKDVYARARRSFSALFSIIKRACRNTRQSSRRVSDSEFLYAADFALLLLSIVAAVVQAERKF